jgi:tRNA (guanine37-N1)-methyltransferase
MRIDIISIFPEVIEACCSYSMIKRAREQELVTVNAVDLRDFAFDKHKQVDDYPYGGGAGMILKPEPLFRAVKSLSSQNVPEVIVLTPAGKPFDQEEAHKLAKAEHIILICGHYEGIDQRVLDHLATKELSIGDYILTGGELPAMVIADAVIRLLPGVLGNQDSLVFESFEEGMLEHPQYTRPADFQGLKVPEVLLSGNHQEIKRWRREQAFKKTIGCRPELLEMD